MIKRIVSKSSSAEAPPKVTLLDADSVVKQVIYNSLRGKCLALGGGFSRLKQQFYEGSSGPSDRFSAPQRAALSPDLLLPESNSSMMRQ